MSTTTTPPRGDRDFFTSIEAAQEARAIADARARRRKLLRWSSPVVAVVGLAAAFLLAICGVVLVGERSYAATSYTSAAGQFGVLRSVNAVETWKPHYNVGTSEYSSGRFFAATQELEHALTLVPRAPEGEPPGRDECLVRINLSLSYEGLGDEAARASDHPMAISYYDQALAMIQGCGSGGGGGGSQQEQESADQAQDRQEQKQDEQQQEQGGEGAEGEGENEGENQGGNGEDEGDQGEDEGEQGGQPSPSPSDSEGEGGEGDPTPSDSGTPSETSTMSDQQRELEERNRDAQEEREREQQEEGGGSGGGQGW